MEIRILLVNEEFARINKARTLGIEMLNVRKI